MAEKSYKGRCMKCKKQVTMETPKIKKMKNGRRMAKGVCPKCGTVVCRILGKND